MSYSTKKKTRKTKTNFRKTLEFGEDTRTSLSFRPPSREAVKHPNPVQRSLTPPPLPIAGGQSSSAAAGDLDPAMDDFVLVDDFGPFKPAAASTSSTSVSASHYDDMFDSYFNRSAEPAEPSPSSSAPSPPPPVFDKPVFDDDPDAADPFDAIPLFGDGGGGGEGEDFLDSLGKSSKIYMREPEVVGFDDDLIAGLGSTKSKTPVGEVEQKPEAAGFVDDLISGFSGSAKPMKPVPQSEPREMGFEDDVIPGFGESTDHHDSPWGEPRIRQEKESISSSKTTVSIPENPFVTLGTTSNLEYSSFGLFTDHLDNVGMPMKSEGGTKLDAPSTASGMFDSSDIFGGVPKPVPSLSFASEKESVFGENISPDDSYRTSYSNKLPREKTVQRPSAEAVGSILPEMNFAKSSDIHEDHEAAGPTGFQNSDPVSRNIWDHSPEENQCSKMPDDVWLTVSDVILVTQPTSTPPPSRPPPPLATKQPPIETSKFDELGDFVMVKLIDPRGSLA
ncbi:hypothetical protein GUJ93_ZPchr0008g11420 [Zizania palustris]|uniref:Uncharacterized protein n=1 Tax=Zizania palustris TaxID=103762 RepID=A0A8J5R3Y7_ZIZPA|nr:hypothetical protein GUJ93_ZPchr0008g11420 [Zizania palustris]